MLYSRFQTEDAGFAGFRIPQANSGIREIEFAGFRNPDDSLLQGATRRLGYIQQE